MLATLDTFTINTFAADTDPGPDETTTVSVQTPDDSNNSDPTRRPPVTVPENNIQRLKLYPNPAIGNEFTIDLPLSDAETIGLFIHDMNGRLVERKSGSYSELRHFSVRHLQEATYVVKVFSKDVLFQSRVMVLHR